MLPFDVPWYRRLLRFAVLLGLAGGILGLIYLGSTGWVIDRVFPESEGAAWSGEWWWIPLTAFGGFILVSLRMMWNVPDHVPGGVQLIEAAEVDHRTAPQWVVMAVISAITGASLGPSFALVVMGGGLGSWVASRRWAEGSADQDYTLTGIAGALGGAFTSPILGAFMVSELEPLPRNRYVASIIPQLIASMIGFVVFFSVAGRTFLGTYEVPPYEFEITDILIAVALGAMAAAVMLIIVGITLAVRWVCTLVPNRYALGVVGGALVGLIAMALPLTVGAGQAQLGVVIEGSASLGIGLLTCVLFAKILAMSVSLEVGFLGGNVFPMIFIGGTAGTIAHLAFPEIPIALAVGCMLAAVPGSYLRAPISLVLIAAIALYLDAETIAPVAIAVVSAYLIVATIRYVVSNRRAASTDPQSAGTAAA